MARAKKYGLRPSVRATDDELCELRKRAKSAKLSLSRYLVECGLRSGNPPDPRERELRERALFEVRKAGVNLNQVARCLNQQAGIVSREQVELAISATMEALKLLSDAFGRGIYAR